MRKAYLIFCLLMFSITPIAAQNDDECLLPPRLLLNGGGRVSFTDGQPLNVRDDLGVDAAVIGQIPEGGDFVVTFGPSCLDGINWWAIEASDDLVGWVAEGVDDVYFIEPSDWTWLLFTTRDIPDPMELTLPSVYAGDLPALPVDLTDVDFVNDTGLNEQQLALLAQNGFVVVPGSDERFYDTYSGYGDEWGYDSAFSSPIGEDGLPTELGQPNFITADVVLNSLYDVFHQLLAELEREEFYPLMYNAVLQMTSEANAQYQAAMGTSIEIPARNTLLYLTVALQLMDAIPWSESPDTRQPIFEAIAPDVLEEAQIIKAQILAADTQSEISFLTDYTENFGAYRVRGYYEGDPLLESYFRMMTWLGRITFRANNPSETLSALLMLRALQTSGAYDNWFDVQDTLGFFIGPVDDLSPLDYYPLAESIFGADLSLEALSDETLLQSFMDGVTTLPAPRVNGLVLAADTSTEDIAELTRGFRLMGQRFTFDGYLLGQLFTPYVESRPLPSGLDVPAVLGSDVAVNLVNGDEQYQGQLASLRGEVTAITEENWQENIYSYWLYTLDAMWNHENPAAYPPLMSTEPWMLRELQSGLASYTELKHATVLYVKQPEGFGGGGPPLLAYGYVEPNPVVFARIAILSGRVYLYLLERGFIPDQYLPYDTNNLFLLGGALRSLSEMAGRLAEIARKELTGEPITDDEYFYIQEAFRNHLQVLEVTVYEYPDIPPVALVTDIATNSTFQTALQVGVGAVDYIFVVIPGPRGYQVARGGVFSYYEFVGDSNNRLTDSEWRERAASGDLPARPEWIDPFFSE